MSFDLKTKQMQGSVLRTSGPSCVASYHSLIGRYPLGVWVWEDCVVPGNTGQGWMITFCLGWDICRMYTQDNCRDQWETRCE